MTVTGVTTSEVEAGGYGLGMYLLRQTFSCPATFPIHRLTWRIRYANDYMTGYLMAVGGMLALSARAQRGGSYHVNASLCQSAMWLQRHGLVPDRHVGRSIVPVEHFGFGSKDGLVDLEEAVPGLLEDVDTGTAFGTLRHLCVVPEMSGTPARFERTSVPLGTHAAEW